MTNASPVPDAHPIRWEKTTAALFLVTCGNTLLLRYIHVHGIEAVYIDLLATPQAGLPILGLTQLLLFMLAFVFTLPIWLMSNMLLEGGA